MIPKTTVLCCPHRKNSSWMGGDGPLPTLPRHVNGVILVQQQLSSSRLVSQLESGRLEGISLSGSFRSTFGPTTISPRTRLPLLSIFVESGGGPAGRWRFLSC